MPKLLLFVPCEKVIADEEGNPTLIVILQNMEVQVPEGEFPANVVLPKEWDVVTLINALPGDAGKHFVQHVDLQHPDGSAPMKSEIKFTFAENAIGHRNKVHFIGMPVGQTGEYKLRLWLFDESTGVPAEPTAMYPMYVRHRFEKSAPVALSSSK